MEEESYVVDYNNYVKDDNVVIVVVVVVAVLFLLLCSSCMQPVRCFIFFPSFPASFPGLACKNLPDHNISSRYNESHPYVSRGNMHESCQSSRARIEQCICTTLAQDLSESAHRSPDEMLIL